MVFRHCSDVQRNKSNISFFNERIGYFLRNHALFFSIDKVYSNFHRTIMLKHMEIDYISDNNTL